MKIIYFAAIALFLLFYAVMSPEYIGDTYRYAHDVVMHAEGVKAPYWEFAHLLWRPWGYLGLTLFGSSFAQWYGDKPIEAVIRFYIYSNALWSTAMIAAMVLLVSKLVKNRWFVLATTIPLTCAYTMVDYSHSGAPYIPGLFISTLTVYLLMRAVETGKVLPAILAGLTYCFATALWLPFLSTGLGMVAVVWFWKSPEPPTRNERLRLMAWFLVTLGIAVGVIFTSAAMAAGVDSVASLKLWITSVSNGMTQTMNPVRLVTGMARSMWNFGFDTIALKRFTFKDPYNPSKPLDLVLTLGWKIGLFYLGLAAMWFVLWKERRKAFYVVLAGSLPLVILALLIFEVGASERFLPVFVFVYPAFAIVLDRWKQQPLAAFCLALLLAAMSVVSLYERSRSAGIRVADTERRIEAIRAAVKPGAVVYVTTFRDDAYWVAAARPLNRKLMLLPEIVVTDVIEVATVRIPTWRTDIAREAREKWAAGKEVWFSERLLASRPEKNWHWVEGDDQRVHWVDLPEVFTKLQTDTKILPGADGFQRVIPNDANRALLDSLR